MSIKIVVLLFSFIILVHSCNTTEPPLPEKTITLKLEDASCTEAWITLTTTNLQLPAAIRLKQNNAVTEDIVLSNADTLLYIDSLFPNTTHTFQATSHSGLSGITSNELAITTMDTTSHNFTWQTWTFGEHSSSVLRDVAIIDKNNIWAVGEIYLNDSLGQPDPHAYNAVHWDGTKWNLFRIMFYTICGQQSRTSYPAKAIFAFSENDIWVAMNGDQVARLNRTIQTETICLPFSFVINKLWGESQNSMYAVGNGGNVAWYDGQSWQRIESGTELHINDIWGAYNSKTMGNEVLCVASNRFINEGSKVLRIDGMVAKQVVDEGLPWSLNSVWFITERKYFISGDGLYSTTSLNKKWSSISNLPNYYKTSIRGKTFNDIIAVGAFGLLLHYNGFNWKDFQNITYINGSFTRLDINRNLVACVGGLNYGQAIILIGRR